MFKNKKRLSPFQIITVGYLFVIGVGTLFLLFPFMKKPTVVISVIDTLFTVVSATCVTGLTVVNTAASFNFLGQLILLLLIQIGGLGYMTVATLLVLILKKKVSLRDRFAIKESLNQHMPGGMVFLILNIIKMTFFFEILGSILLFISLKGNYNSLLERLWVSIFHAVSAFCNCGLDLFRSSLIEFNNNILFISTIATLIIIGGLGFFVLKEIKEFFLSKTQKGFSVHSKIVLIISSLLILIGFLFFKLHGYSCLDSFFMSVTTRTAGFNTQSLTTFSPILILLVIILMLIGASPGGTGGGVKTTTFFCFFFPLKMWFQNKRRYEIFNRRINEQFVLKAIALVSFYISLLLFMTFLIYSLNNLPIHKVLFEVTSALGTVGLSLGITSKLNFFSKILIIIIMLIGRIGLLTFSMNLLSINNKQELVYPEEKIFI